MNKYGIQVGQIWQDYDIRFRNHTPVYKKVFRTDKTYAYCEGYKLIEGKKVIISKTKIRLNRFKSNATGYLFITQELSCTNV
jgi:hypothetical protein